MERVSSSALLLPKSLTHFKALNGQSKTILLRAPVFQCPGSLLERKGQEEGSCRCGRKRLKSLVSAQWHQNNLKRPIVTIAAVLRALENYSFTNEKVS